MSNTYKFTIDKREVTTTVIATEPELDRSLKDMLSSFTPKFSTAKRVVGLGIEKRFETIYNRGPKVCDRVAILKLCHGTTCLIIQLHLMSSPPFSLSGFLQRPELSFVGVGIKHSLEALVAEYGIKCGNAVDLAQLAATVNKNDIFKAFGLFDLAYEFCEYCRFDDHVEKMVSNFHDVALSNWGVTALSGKQIEAATWTCFLCFFIGNYLLGGTLPSTSRGY